MIQRGEFREDLYDRLAVLTIETAPLIERREDIRAMMLFSCVKRPVLSLGKQRIRQLSNQ